MHLEDHARPTPSPADRPSKIPCEHDAPNDSTPALPVSPSDLEIAALEAMPPLARDPSAGGSDTPSSCA